MISLTEEPLWPYLHEIAARPETKGTILTGGLGLRVKKAYLDQLGDACLFREVPELRATADLDFLLRLQLWTEVERAIAFRKALGELGYDVILHSWHFQKPFEGQEGRRVKLDLQARPPREGEAVKVRKKQVGKEMGTELAGYLTPEAFAVDDSPIEIPITHQEVNTSILVPHPYAWLNLKVAAANDWRRELGGEIEPKFVKDAEGKPTDARVREKHVTDVYSIVGMMTEAELTQAEQLTGNYSDHAKAQEIRSAAQTLYGSRESQGSLAIRTYNAGTWAEHFDTNYEVFWDALSRSLGISSGR
jgi:hypothetical protein